MEECAQACITKGVPKQCSFFALGDGVCSLGHLNGATKVTGEVDDYAVARGRGVGTTEAFTATIYVANEWSNYLILTRFIRSI